MAPTATRTVQTSTRKNNAPHVWLVDHATLPAAAPAAPQPVSLFTNLGHHLHTIYLFTASDHKTFVLPETVFGIFSALSGSAMTTDAPPAIEVVKRLPMVLLWTWLNTFVFVLSNQGNEAAIAEDKLNKPWRPLAAGRITLRQTRHLQLAAIPAVLLLTYFWLGGFEETAVLFSLTWMYNELGAADEIFHIRNAVIAAAYVFYGCGALRVAAAADLDQLSTSAYIWLGLTAGVIFTTMSIQDLKDQPGDRVRGRQTAPLVIGEDQTRWGIATAVMMWTLACCFFWDASLYVLGGCALFGLSISARLILKRGFDADKASWKLWSYWLIVMYGLPLCKIH